MDRNKVEKEAKEILEKFSKALEKVEKDKISSSKNNVDEEILEFYNIGEKAERKENETEKCDFKESLLENAPKKNKDFIIAEKGVWK